MNPVWLFWYVGALAFGFVYFAELDGFRDAWRGAKRLAALLRRRDGKGTLSPPSQTRSDEPER